MNRNKAKGDRAERAVLSFLQQFWPTIKTRAGYNDDLGDLICTTPRGLLCVQVKDVAQARWGEWFEQLESQVAALRANTTEPVVGGVLVWKVRGCGDPAGWRVVFRLGCLPGLLGC